MKADTGKNVHVLLIIIDNYTRFDHNLDYF